MNCSFDVTDLPFERSKGALHKAVSWMKALPLRRDGYACLLAVLICDVVGNWHYSGKRSKRRSASLQRCKALIDSPDGADPILSHQVLDRILTICTYLIMYYRRYLPRFTWVQQGT